MLANLDELHNNLQGVDLDEEAANLVMYQTSYQAAAKVISVTDAMLDALISLV
jgi:flagellar hook-associated protein 1 FlgK